MDSEPSVGLAGQVKMLASTCLSALQNRGELFLVELEEEKTRALELLIWAMAAGLLGLMFLVVFTAVVILLFPAGMRIWPALGFCLLYFIGALVAILNLKAHLKYGPPPFSGSINEMKKDRACLESSK